MLTINCAECGDTIASVKTQELADKVKDEIYCNDCAVDHEMQEAEEAEGDEEVVEEKEEENA